MVLMTKVPGEHIWSRPPGHIGEIITAKSRAVYGSNGAGTP